MTDLVEEKQIFKMLDGSLQIDVPAPLFFVVKQIVNSPTANLAKLTKLTKK